MYRTEDSHLGQFIHNPFKRIPRIAINHTEHYDRLPYGKHKVNAVYFFVFLLVYQSVPQLIVYVFQRQCHKEEYKRCDNAVCGINLEFLNI